MSTPVPTRIPAPAAPRSPRLAWRPVLLVAGVVGAVLMLVSNRYGYFGDELYFIAAGRRLDVGYADQPPLLPAVAAAVTALAGDSLVALRMLPMLLSMGTVVATALIAREFGGGRRAQVLAAVTYPTSTFLLSSGHVLYTSTVDVLLWTVLLWTVVRWTRTGDDRLLLWAGAVVAVAVQVKYLILALVVAVVVAAGPRNLARRKAFRYAAGLVVLSLLPGLVWQAAHGWPQVSVARQISADTGIVGRVGFLALLAVTAGVLVGVTLAVYGLFTLVRTHGPYRFLGWAALGLVVAVFAAGGRPFYLAGLLPLLWAAAAARLESHQPARWWRWIPTRPVIALSALYALTALPVVPVDWHRDGVNPVAAGSVGWPELVDTVTTVYRGLPPEERAAAVLVTQTYWQASALDMWRKSRDLPPVYSGDRGFAYFGRPAESSGTVLWVGYTSDPVRSWCAALREAARSQAPTGTHTVWVCTGRTVPWSTIWPGHRNL